MDPRVGVGRWNDTAWTGSYCMDARAGPRQPSDLGRVFRIVSQRGVWVFQKLEHGRSQSRYYGFVRARVGVSVCMCVPRAARGTGARAARCQRAWMFEHRR